MVQEINDDVIREILIDHMDDIPKVSADFREFLVAGFVHAVKELIDHQILGIVDDVELFGGLLQDAVDDLRLADDLALVVDRVADPVGRQLLSEREAGFLAEENAHGVRGKRLDGIGFPRAGLSHDHDRNTHEYFCSFPSVYFRVQEVVQTFCAPGMTLPESSSRPTADLLISGGGMRRQASWLFSFSQAAAAAASVISTWEARR